jgi:hypothetical protein
MGPPGNVRMSHDGDTGIGGAEIDPNDFTYPMLALTDPNLRRRSRKRFRAETVKSRRPWPICWPQSLTSQ